MVPNPDKCTSTVNLIDCCYTKTTPIICHFAPLKPEKEGQSTL